MTIPDDVNKAASEAIAGTKCFPPSDFDALHVSVAHAILAERQRCADVVYLAAMDGKTALQAWRDINPA